MAKHEQLLRVWRVAKILDVSKKRVYQMVQEGKIDAIRLGPRSMRIASTSLEAFLSRSRFRGFQGGASQEDAFNALQSARRGLSADGPGASRKRFKPVTHREVKTGTRAQRTSAHLKGGADGKKDH